jgi:hypothetical protein
VSAIVKDWEAPFKAAVKRAVWLEATAAALAVNVALLSPAPTDTLAGTDTLVLLLDNATLTMLEVTPLSVTVQVDVPGPITVAGEQARLPI